MKRRKSSIFSNDDRVLWKRVADTTTPLTPKRGEFLKKQMAQLMEDTTSISATAHLAKSERLKPERPKAAVSTKTPQQKVEKLQRSPIAHPIEKPVLKKLSRGARMIDSRLDLHGMTQDRARFALLDFLQMAQRCNHRIVLIITGKGNQGQGVLRANVPRWLEQPQFASLVNGVQTAHASHGGEGALYVRIRKSSAFRR